MTKEFQMYFDDWLSLDTWDLREASYLLLNTDPEYAKDLHHPGHEIHVDAQSIYKRALAAEGVSLQMVSKTVGNHPGRVKPHVFIEWALERYPNVPAPLVKYLEEQARKYIEPSAVELTNVRKTNTNKIELRANIIGDRIKKQYADPLCLPDGAKKQLYQTLHNEDGKLFTSEPTFNKAWGRAIKKGLVKMKNSETFHPSH